MSKLRWDDGSYSGDNRRLLLCGHVAVGAIFLPPVRGRYVRWRVWCTARMNPTEGSARSVDEAKSEVEMRFEEFLMLAGLQAANSIAK